MAAAALSAVAKVAMRAQLACDEVQLLENRAMISENELNDS